MRENENVRLLGRQVELVPYERKFVERYHQWMQDAFLLEMTASEPLSMDEEFEMQKTWREDPKKCTFILLSRTEETKHESDDTEINRMVGDVNLFLQDYYYEWVGEDQIERQEINAEVDIMVAETALRGHGIGKEAVKLMLWYGTKHLQITRFFAKINETNTPSIEMFRKLGFEESHYSKAFQEYEFQLHSHQEAFKNIMNEIDSLSPLQQYLL